MCESLFYTVHNLTPLCTLFTLTRVLCTCTYVLYVGMNTLNSTAMCPVTTMGIGEPSRFEVLSIRKNGYTKRLACLWQVTVAQK